MEKDERYVINFGDASLVAALNFDGILNYNF